MANTLKFGAGQWATKEGSTLAYNDENNNFKPLPFSFERGSSATVVNKDGLIETVGSDMPRIDYKDDSEGALLLEPQRTNLVAQSNNTTTNIWGHYNYGGGLIVDTYGYPSPNGKNEASRLVYTNSSLGSGGALLTSNITLLATGVYTISLWAKSVSGTKEIRFSPRDTSSAGTAGSKVTLTNQWKRYTHTFTNDGGTNRGFQFRLSDSEDSGDRTFDVWGITIEEGSYATSVIPTQGSAVTRLADSCSQTPPDGVIGQTEGTVFLDFKPQTLDATSRFLSIENSSSVSNGWMGIFSALVSGDIRFRFYGDGWDFNSTLIIEKDTRYKIAVSYKNGVQTSAYVNGNLIGNLTASLSGKSFQKIRLSEAAIGVRGDADFNDIKLYNTRLSNSELQALTS